MYIKKRNLESEDCSFFGERTKKVIIRKQQLITSSEAPSFKKKINFSKR